MPFTVQKNSILVSSELERAGCSHNPVFVAPADGPMTPSPSIESSVMATAESRADVWCQHGTVWLRANLHIQEAMQGQQVVMQLYWETTPMGTGNTAL